jgi:preprotein translocase subunit SecA
MNRKPDDVRAARGSWIRRLSDAVPLLRDASARRRAAAVAAINDREAETKALTVENLRTASLSLRHRARSGEPLPSLLPSAFALVREAIRRIHGWRLYDVQLLAGTVLHERMAAEMQTGEGKTLTAALPLYLHALTGRGAQLATANDYLAERDATLVRHPLALLGLTTGLVLGSHTPCERRRAYRADVTYGTVKEFGFDFLRDRLAQEHRRIGNLFVETNATTSSELLQRPPEYLLVDEADAACIDEADTPLVIGTLDGEDDAALRVAYRWSSEQADEFIVGTHYVRTPPARRVELTAAGRALARALTVPAEVQRLGLGTLYEFLERAIRVGHDFLRNRDYVVEANEILIIDPHTGRASPGRRWQDGIHEAIEAREKLEIRAGAGQAAKITVQSFLLRYPQLAGMTGTVAGADRELRRVYRLGTAKIPTHRPSQRVALPTQIFGHFAAKADAVIAEVIDLNAQGRPVLIGTRSIEKSEQFAERLQSAGLKPQILHALNAPREAGIVAQAGGRGAVTVATSMAGRGTDIRLGPGVAELGGLHVICTEMHESPRIDRQQIGRAARQGDPGSHRTFLALDDDILSDGLSASAAERLKQFGCDQSLVPEGYLRYFLAAQKRCEAKRAQRRTLLTFVEQERCRVCDDLGTDPYLDAA